MSRMAGPLRAVARPGIEIRQITINLRDDTGKPEVVISGTVKTGNRFVDNGTTAAITTSAMTEAGKEFIRQMYAAFAVDHGENKE